MRDIEIVRGNELERGFVTNGITRGKAFESNNVVFSLTTVAGGSVSGWHHHGKRELYAFVRSGHLKLEKKGHAAHAVTLTGMGERVHLASKDVGIETAIQDVLNVIKYNDLDDVVLVGHSFAGKVAAAVADRVPERMRMILYLDAFRPDKVRTPQGGFDPNEWGKLDPGEWRIPFTEKILDGIGKDVQGPDREWMLSKVTPWPTKHSSDPVTLSKSFDSVKSAYIFCAGSGDPIDEILKGKWECLKVPTRS